MTMTPYKMIKAAAAALRASADEIESQEKQIKAASAKTAAPVMDKVAAEKQAQLGTLAKQAADRLLSAGLISNAEKRDQFAAQCLDHSAALASLNKLASHLEKTASVPKVGTVVAEGSAVATDTADQGWDKRARAILTRIK